MGEQDDPRAIGRRIQRLRKLRRLNQTEFAKPLGVTRGAVGNWELGKGIKRENLVLIAEKHSVDINWLATSRGESPRETTDGSVSEGVLHRAGEGYRMPEVEARAGAGDLGAQLRELTTRDGKVPISADAISAEWFLPRAFVRSLGIHDEGVAWIVPIQGDSGYDPDNAGAPGSLFPGDRVIVDTSDRRPSPPGPFLLWDGLGIVVKLAEIARGQESRIRLSSRNPRYKPTIITADEARIIGRIRGRISAM